MRILLIHQFFLVGTQAGGTRHYELARRLVQAGHQVKVLAGQVSYLTGAAESPRRNLVVREKTPEGIAIWRCYSRAALHRSFAHRLLAYWSFTLATFLAGLRTRGMDVVWGTSPPIFQGITALALARLKRVPFVFEVRDLWPDFAVELGVLRQPALIALSRWLERVLYRSADQIIANSPGFLPHLRDCGVAGPKMAVIPNGVEAASFDPANRGRAFRRDLGLDTRFIAMYAGAHGLANDLEKLLEASAVLRDEPGISIVLVGDGKEKANLMQQARDMGLTNVLFVPPQPKERMPWVLAAADVCIAILKPIPMFNTTYPNKVFDYMAAGRPTVLAIDGVIRQVIEEADAGVFVPPGDPKALASAILQFYRDRALRERQGSNARAHVIAHFSRERQAQDLEAVLQGAIRRQGPGRSSYPGKRVIDLALTLPTLALLSPLLALAALALRLSMGPPVFFRQQRPGLNGKPFVLLKFRTMTDARDAQGNLLPDAERLTPLGRFLRKTSLDELPELINVLRGEMSLVGPRPLLMQYLGRYTPEQMRRHEVRPGVTGWAQVNGRNALTWEQKFALDLWYVAHQSLWLDMKIVALTIWKALKREGISQPGEATMAEFQGGSQE